MQKQISILLIIKKTKSYYFSIRKKKDFQQQQILVRACGKKNSHIELMGMLIHVTTWENNLA